MEISYIMKKILKVEENRNIFSKKINDIYFWKIIRFPLLSEIYNNLDFNSLKTNRKRRNIFELIKKNIKFKFQKKQEVDEIFFISDRFFENNKKKYEIYSEFFINKKKSLVMYPENVSIDFFNDEYYYDFEDNFYYLFQRLKLKLENIFMKKNIEEIDSIYLSSLKKELIEEFKLKKLEILEKKRIQDIILNFKNKKKIYEKMLKKWHIKKIYIVCSYGKEPLISAANDLEIEVIEIQHGDINFYHEGYHFPNAKKINYFPDKMFMFGKFWYDNVSLPLSKDKVEFVGYPYMKYQLGKYSGILENKNQILFISQETIGKRIIKKAIEFAIENQDKKIIIRLHPKEFNSWEKEYEFLYKNRNLKNLEISSDNKKTLYEYLLESEYIIGVYSTVISEALYLNKKVGVIDLPGVEYLETMLKLNLIYKFKNKIKLDKLNNLNKINSNYYYNNFIK